MAVLMQIESFQSVPYGVQVVSNKAILTGPRARFALGWCSIAFGASISSRAAIRSRPLHRPALLGWWYSKMITLSEVERSKAALALQDGGVSP